MKRLFVIILAVLMMCTLFAAAVFADEGCAVGETIEEEADGLQKGSDHNGGFYRYIDSGEKYYYFLYREVYAKAEDGVLRVYDAVDTSAEIFLCDEFDLTNMPWIQEVIDAYDGDVEIPMHHVNVIGIFVPEEEYYPEEAIVSEDEYVPREPLPLYSDEIGDYHLYEDGAVKAYVRLNQDAVTVVMEGSSIAVYDNDGNYIMLDFWFNLSEHPWFEAIADEYARQNIEVPEVGIPAYSPTYTGGEVWIEEPPEDVFGCEPNYGDREEDGYSIPQEGYDGSAGTTSNPNTGVVVVLMPAVIAAGVAVSTKSKGALK